MSNNESVLSLRAESESQISAKKIMFAMALSGGAALIYEVVATQALMYFFNSSSYSVATVISSFLFGLAIGSLTISKYLPKIKNKYKLFFILQISTAIYAVLILTQYNHVSQILSYFYNIIGNNFTLNLIVKFLIGNVYLLSPTIMLGASFPLACSLIIKEVKKAGSDVGKLYSWDLFGAILGALIAGFILMPVYGLKIAFVFGAVLNVVAGLLVVKKNKKILFTVVGLVLIVLGVFMIVGVGDEKVSVVDGGINENRVVAKWFDDKDVLFAENSAYGEVRVVNDPVNGLGLYINRQGQCFERIIQGEKEVFNFISNKITNKAKILNIGLGCGFTLNKILQHEKTENVDVVEINPAVVEASRYFKEALNSLNDSRTKLIIDDGVHYLDTTNKKYDLVIVSIDNPLVIYSSPLYTSDYFKIINNKILKKNGMFILWAYAGSYDYTKILYKSLKESFKYVIVLNESAFHNLIYVASNSMIENGGLTAKEKERMNKLENDTDYILNTLDNNVLGNLLIKEGVYK